MLSRFSHVQLLAAPQTVAHQAPLSTGFSRQECWNGLPCPHPGNLPNPGIESECLNRMYWQVSSLPLVLPGKPEKAYTMCQRGLKWSGRMSRRHISRSEPYKVGRIHSLDDKLHDRMYYIIFL